MAETGKGRTKYALSMMAETLRLEKGRIKYASSLMAEAGNGSH